MIIAALAFTDAGYETGRKLSALSGEFRLERCRPGGLHDWTAGAFSSADALIYVGACGIAVRAIAPFARSKAEDPCVLVVDEQGRYVIPVLSGHIGGGNELALEAAGLLNALPVITTATDLNGLFAVDVWARRQSLCIRDIPRIKLVSGRLLQGLPVRMASEFPISGQAPDGVVLSEEDPHVTVGVREPSGGALHLIAPCVTAGIGCRRGIAAEAVEESFVQALSDAGLAAESVSQAASVDLKKDEPGLLDFCRRHSLPFVTFPADELSALPGEFTSSDFVRSVTGTDSVCERAAVAASGGKLIFEKHAYHGVTVAFAVSPPNLSWE